MGSPVVVEAKVALERSFEPSRPREATAPQLGPPLLEEHWLLEAVHEAVAEAGSSRNLASG